jgi:hypothetical protein
VYFGDKKSIRGAVSSLSAGMSWTVSTLTVVDMGLVEFTMVLSVDDLGTGNFIIELKLQESIKKVILVLEVLSCFCFFQASL